MFSVSSLYSKTVCFTVGILSHSLSMLLSGETQLPLLLCYILLFFLCCFSPSIIWFPVALLCCPNQCAHPTPFTLFLYNATSSLFLLLLSSPFYFTACFPNWALHKRTPSSSLLPTFILPVRAFSRHTLHHSFFFSSSSRCNLWGSLSPSHPHPSSP